MHDLTNLRILILDLDPPSGLGGILFDILETFGTPKIHFPQNLPDISNPSGLTRKIKGFCSHPGPELIFLILPSDPDIVLQSLAAVKTEGTILPPIIAIIRKEYPVQVMNLLKSGVSDFIIPPFQASDLLPRIRRLSGRYNGQEPLSTLREKIGLIPCPPVR